MGDSCKRGSQLLPEHEPDNAEQAHRDTNPNELLRLTQLLKLGAHIHMKRDMDLIRLLLQDIESEEPKPNLSGYSNHQCFYHLELMEDAGLIVVGFLRGGGGEIVGIEPGLRLTNLGHDFLEASRSETVWAKFRQAVIKVGGSVSVPVAIELLKRLVKTELDL